MKKKVLVLMLSVSTLFTTQYLQAQFTGGGSTPGGGGAGGGTPLTGGGPVVPFDGGMSLLLLASGIGYGVDKLKRK